MKIIALIPNKHIGNYTDQQWLEVAFKYGVVYSEEEYDRLKINSTGYYFQALTVDNEFNVITPQ